MHHIFNTRALPQVFGADATLERLERFGRRARAHLGGPMPREFSHASESRKPDALDMLPNQSARRAVHSPRQEAEIGVEWFGGGEVDEQGGRKCG